MSREGYCRPVPGKGGQLVVDNNGTSMNNIWLHTTRRYWEKEQRSTEKEMECQHKGRHEEIQLTEDLAQYRKYWMTKLMAGPAQEYGQ